MSRDCTLVMPTRPAHGFVLAVTLWLLAGIAILVGIISLWALEEVRAATDYRNDIEDQLSVFSTRETVLYLAATRNVTLAGLPIKPIDLAKQKQLILTEFGALRRDPVGGELWLDDTHYQGVGESRFSIQDEAGLVQVVWPDASTVDRFLLSQGVAQEKIPALRDALLDYIDDDDMTHLAGAEKREYERAGRAPPPERRLLAPIELLSVLGWSGLSAEQRAAIPNMVTTYYAGPVNLNTAPRALLPTWISGCPVNCDALVDQRRQSAFVNSQALQGRLGIKLPGDDYGDYRFLAGDVLRMTFWGRSGVAWRVHVALTPVADKQAPWSILAAYPIPRPDDAQTQPTGSDFFADSPPARP